MRPFFVVVTFLIALGLSLEIGPVSFIVWAALIGIFLIMTRPQITIVR